MTSCHTVVPHYKRLGLVPESYDRKFSIHCVFSILCEIHVIVVPH
jgi:hypothetical protein